MTRRICSKVKSRTTDRAPACRARILLLKISSIFQSKLAICSCSYAGLPAPGVSGSAQVGMSGEAASRIAKLRREGAGSYGRQSRARGMLLESRVATSRHPRSRPTLFMSRTSLGTVQEPLAHTDTPDPDGRRRKKVRWNSDSILGDKQDDSEENTDECKVRSSCPFMSTSFRHLTLTHRRLSRRFV